MILVIPVFVPHAGCPHDCCFCNQKIISGSKKLPGADEIADKIGSYASEAVRYGEVEIAFFGGSFTAIEPEAQEHYLRAAAPFLKINGGFADCIRISTRPDAIDEKVIERLKKYSVRIVELGAQSMDDNVLRLSERGHTAEDTRKASALLKAGGFTLGLQTMTGLPGADRKSDTKTALEIASIEPAFVRIYPTVVVKNTKLFRDYEAGLYRPMPLDDAVSLCSELCEIYSKHNISVARIGLQSTDSITINGEESEVAGGPYHEAFGQLVRSYDALQSVSETLDNVLKKHLSGSPGTLTLRTEPRYFSDALGQNRANAEKLRSSFGFEKVILSSSADPGGPSTAKRAGRVVSAESFKPDNAKYEHRLAKVTKAEVTVRREPTGRDSFRIRTDVTAEIVFKSLK